jgi:chitodextrinase
MRFATLLFACLFAAVATPTFANWPNPQANLDVGAPALAGKTTVLTAGSAYDITAAGADIYASSDQFHFAYQAQGGDFDLRVRVASLTPTNEWSKAGLMARESMAAGSREVSVFATPAGGYEFQYRATTGALVQKVDSVARVTYPNSWVRLRRAGDQFISYTSVDGANWTQSGTTTLALPAAIFLGMAATSHDVAKTVLAQFRDLVSPDTTPPSVPSSLAAVAVSATQINLSWNASTHNVGVAGYKVMRGGVQIATTTSLTYADTGLAPSTVYTYTVAAFDAAGNTSAPSAPASAKTAADTTPPSIPTGLSATAISSSQINLSWNASTDNVAVASYKVMRNGVLIGGTSALTYADSGLAAATRYSYTVAAVDTSGNVSAPSAAASATTAAASSRSNSSLGTNLSAIRDWSQERPFIDAFHASRPWVSGAGLNGAWDDGRALATDADGWVTSLQANQVARTLMFTDLGGRYPAGTYVVLYDGQGTIAYQDAATKVSGTPGRDVLQVNSAMGGISLHITATTAGNPVRNIRVIMPGGICAGNPYVYTADASACVGAGAFQSFEANYAAIVFHPQFLASIRPYRLLRFMDMGDTNDSTQSAWANRPKPTDARWSIGKGVPVEVMVDLANRLGADPWFTLPHLADNNYMTQYARLVAQTLRTDLKAYVEYSNEVWNSQFAQAAYAANQGRVLSLSVDPFQAQLFYYSRRSVEMFDLWSAEMAPARLVRVIASQADNSWVSEQQLDYLNARAKTDALAMAPYFGYKLGTLATTPLLTLDALFVTLQTVSLPEAIASINSQAAVARLRGVPLISYEGGQHLTGVGGLENNAALNTLFDAANRDARMGALYKTYLDAWKASGAQLFVHYTNCDGYSKWGRWGSLEYPEHPRASAPKYDALQSFIGLNPAWW